MKLLLSRDRKTTEFRNIAIGQPYFSVSRWYTKQIVGMGLDGDGNPYVECAGIELDSTVGDHDLISDGEHVWPAKITEVDE